MTLYEKIMALYPELTHQDFVTAICLQNDSNGRGDYISKWEHPLFTRPQSLEENNISELADNNNSNTNQGN